MADSDGLAPLVKKSGVLKRTAEMFNELIELADTVELPELLDVLIDKTGYAQELKKEGDEGVGRLENIAELKSTMQNYIDENEEPTLSGFLEEISLYTDIDSLDNEADYVVLMTMHAAKGLEFPTVFVTAMEENVFPSSRSIEEGEIEEERRLAYVAVTRAKKKLFLTYSTERLIYGRSDRNRVSRFIKELPQELLETKDDVLLAVEKGELEPPRSISLQQQMRNRASSSEPVEMDLSVGERVTHKIFGEGTVLSAKPMGSDVLVEIAFDSRGTKKVMARYAKLKKV